MTNRMPGDSEREGSGELAGGSHAQRITRLFSEHNDSLVRFLAVRLHSVQEAKEVAQEAYVRLLSLDDSGAVSFLRAFLFKTAANLAVDRLRSRNRQRQAMNAGLCDESARGADAGSRGRTGGGGGDCPTIDRRAAAEMSARVSPTPDPWRRFLADRKEMELSERMVRHYVLRAVLYCRAGLDAAQV